MFKLWRRASHKKVVQKETINVSGATSQDIEHPMPGRNGTQQE